MTENTPTKRGERLLSLLRSLSRDVDSVTHPYSASPYFDSDVDALVKTCLVDADLVDLAVRRLPKLGKWLDIIVSTGEWSEPPEEIVSYVDLDDHARGTWKTVPIVDGILSQHGRIRDLVRHRVLDEVLTPELFGIIRQALLMFKKFELPCPKGVVKEAVREFWSVDDGLREPRSTLTPSEVEPVSGFYSEAWRESDSKTLFKLLAMMDVLADRLAPGCDLDPVDLVPGHGPGAVSDLPYAGDKYTFPNYPQVIEEFMPHLYFTGANWRVAEYLDIVPLKVPAKLIAVAKTIEKPRLIASEPVVHQFLQQGLMKWIRMNLHPIHKIMVDFTDQTPSQRMALKASRDGKAATVDLSAASDRLSTWVVESQFRWRPELLRALLVTRSDSIKDPILLNATRRIKKFAPMGSAVTFPVQSIVYANACLACGLVYENAIPWCLTTRRLKRLAGKIRVFGDDLLLPKEWLPLLSLLLNALELKINSDKTHYMGSFRESCGMDAYKGVKVTPVYVSRTAPTRLGESLLAYVEQSNNAWAGGLWHLATEMVRQIPDKIRKMIPISSESLGVCTLYTFTRGTLASRKRMNRDLQRWDVKGMSLSPRERIYKRGSQLDLLQYFLEDPSPESLWEAGVRLGRRAKPELVWTSAMAEKPGRLISG